MGEEGRYGKGRKTWEWKEDMGMEGRYGRGRNVWKRKGDIAKVER